jgi:hypothetical protein
VVKFFRGFVRDTNRQAPDSFFSPEVKPILQKLQKNDTYKPLCSLLKFQTLEQCKTYIDKLLDINLRFRHDVFKPTPAMAKLCKTTSGENKPELNVKEIVE